TPASHFVAPIRAGLLQRKCACGGTLGSDGECEECHNKRLSVQRRAGSQAGPTEVPPIVYEGLRSPGQPLDGQARGFMESRFGHDFSRVRVHTDARAAESARAVGARAYAVGRDVVFGAGQFAPGTEAGRKLLSHELAHVVQQGGKPFKPGGALRLGAPDDAFERQAEAVTAQSSRGAASLAGGARTAHLLQRAPEETGPTNGTGYPGPEDPCAGWFVDHESTSKRAAEHYVRTELA